MIMEFALLHAFTLPTCVSTRDAACLGVPKRTGGVALILASMNTQYHLSYLMRVSIGLDCVELSFATVKLLLCPLVTGPACPTNT